MANKINSKKETKPIVVIIGGGNGIGKASAILMAKMGWRVAVADIDKNASDKVAIKINSESYYIDVKDEESLETASKRIENEMGPVRSLVVCAAIFQDIKPSEKLDYNEWNNIININLSGTFLANKVFAKNMLKRKIGSIVNTSSIAALGSMPVEAYGTSKAGVVHLTKNLAGEWGRSGIRVNCVSPGSTLVDRVQKRLKTNRYAENPANFTALGKMLKPNEIAEVIEFLCSQRSSGMTGTNLVVDAGWHIASSWTQFGGVRKN